MYFAASGQPQVICPNDLAMVYENWATFIKFVYYFMGGKRLQYFHSNWINNRIILYHFTELNVLCEHLEAADYVTLWMLTKLTCPALATPTNFKSYLLPNRSSELHTILYASYKIIKY